MQRTQRNRMKQKEIEALTCGQIKIVLQDNFTDIDDPESIQFIADEIFTNKQTALVSAEQLESVIGQHLINFGFAQEEEVAKICSILYNDLEDAPPEPVEEDDEEEHNSDKDYDDGTCLLCERDMPLTFHHLIPRTTHKKMMKRENMDKKALNKGIMICRPCHSAIHRFIDEETMALEYNTLEKILEHEKVQAWIPYAAKQKTVSKEEAQMYATGVLRYKK